MSSTSGISSQPISLPTAPTADKAGSVQLKIEGKVGKISDLIAEVQSIMKELQALEAPQHPGKDASEEDIKKYQDALATFQKKVASLNQKLSRTQGKLAKVQSQLNKLQSSDLPRAQADDARTLKQWADETQDAIEKQAEATAASTAETQDLTVGNAQDKIRVKVQFIKKAVQLKDGSEVQLKVTQLTVQVGDSAAQAGEKTVTAMPKAPAGGIPGPGVP
jgi:chromosome segregation ATPase